MELTDIEKAIIAAYRDGAYVDIGFHRVEDTELAVELVNSFGKVKQIWDLKGTPVFRGVEGNLVVNAFVY